jgi:hypothetical protein
MQNTSFIHADIFFFVSTIALVVVSIGIIVALVYGIKILRNVRDFTNIAKEEGYDLLRDLRDLRSVLRDEGVKWKSVVDLIRGFFVRDSKKETSKTKKRKQKNKLDEVIEKEEVESTL